MKLPAKAKVGDAVKLDLAPIVPVVLGSDVDCDSAPADVKLAAWDAAAHTARFEGRVVVKQHGDLDGLDATMETNAACTIEVDTADRRVRSLLLEGEFAMTGAKPPLKGKGQVRVALKTDTGKAAADARKQKPNFRKRPFRAGPLGVEVELPSYYSRTTKDAETILLRTTDVDDEGAVNVILAPVDADASKPKAYFDQLEAELKKNHKDLRSKSVKSGLGEGRAYNLTSKGENGKSYLVQSEFYPFQGHFIVFKLIGPPKAFKKAQAEFEKARAGLVAAAAE